MRYIITETQFEELKDKIVLDIKVGDTLLGGRFKNKKVKVKEIGKNEKGDVTINGKPLLKFRIMKESVDNRIIDVLVKLKLTNYNEIYDFLHETGYDRNEIKEIYSIYFESVSGLELTPFNWMDYYFNPDQLEEIEPDYDDMGDDMDDDMENELLDNVSTKYEKNGIIVMEDDFTNTSFWFDWKNIWSPLENIFDLDYDDVHKVLRKWLTKNMGKEWHSIDHLELS